jgi:ABC-type glycerol-3-phosphate transport system substrate-binding protein
MTKVFTLIAALLAASACTATATTATPYAGNDAPIECIIRTTATSQGVSFEAIANANYPASGEYEFRLTREESGNSSDIVQSGEFDLRGGDSAVLGGADISMSGRSHYRARLVLSDGHAELCRTERRS